MKVLVKGFIKKESSSGIVLIFITLFALLLRNSPLSGLYDDFLHTTIELSINTFQISKPFYLWINDGLMVLFFLVIGLEVKRELVAGHLSSWSKIALPGIAAIGGMLLPALIYTYFNYSDSDAMRGWAIPTATDIAFSLGILSLLGRRVPVSLKIFLMALAIIDDIGAIIIISLFYTTDLSSTSLFSALLIIILLIVMNKFGIRKLSLYMLVGIVLWVLVLKSGVHATLVGIILAFAIPLNAKTDSGKSVSPANKLRRNLHYWVAFLILPIFAFVNAGVDLRTLDYSRLLDPVPLGIIMGLFLGKQFGVFIFVYIAIKLNLAQLPKCTTWAQLYGVCVLTGIGFTMSLFIDSLAFMDDTKYAYTDRLGILIASLLSGLLGYLILKFSKRNKNCKI